MRKFNVTFEIFNANGTKSKNTITIEAGNKKMAALRAMVAINKFDGYSELYKNIIKIEEVV